MRQGTIRIMSMNDDVVFDPPAFGAKYNVPSGHKWALNVNFCAVHFENFLDCIRTRRKPNADIEIGQRTLTVTHLATICYRLNRPLRWDPVKEDFVNDPEASRYLDTALRAPWRI
jgi:hypothetical protein